MAKRQFKFSKRAIDALPPAPADNPSKEIEYSDTDVGGLRLVINKLGRKSFLLRYSIHGRKRSLKVGGYPELDVSEARQQAIEWRALIGKGIDPQEHQAQQATAQLTMQQFFDRYYIPHIRDTLRSAKAIESRVRNHILPSFGSKVMSQVTTLALQQFHNERKTALCPATANRIMEIIQRSYSLALQWGLVTANPAKPIRLHREQNVRERYLSRDELSRFLKALKAEKSRSAADAFLFALATGARRTNVLQARWDQVDMERRVWSIPAASSKSGRALHLVLNEVAMDVLTKRVKMPGNPFIFNGRPGTYLGNPTRAWRRVMKAAGIDSATMHTLRHTHGSYIAAVSSLTTVAALLGHRSEAMSARYSHVIPESLHAASSHMATVIKSAETS